MISFFDHKGIEIVSGSEFWLGEISTGLAETRTVFWGEFNNILTYPAGTTVTYETTGNLKIVVSDGEWLETGSFIEKTIPTGNGFMQFTVVFLEEILGDYTGSISIKIDGNQVGIFKYRCEFIGEDPRLKDILDSLGYQLLPEDLIAFDGVDPNESGVDWKFLNAKRKEIIIEGHNIYPFIGSYRALINALHFLGYKNLKMKEYWLNIDERNPYFGKYRHTDIIELFSEKRDPKLRNLFPSKVYKKTNLFGLYYDIVVETGEFYDNGEPVTKEIFSFTPEEVLTKMFALKRLLKKVFLPLQSKIIDIVGEGIYWGTYKLSTGISQNNSFQIEKGEQVQLDYKKELWISDLTGIEWLGYPFPKDSLPSGSQKPVFLFELGATPFSIGPYQTGSIKAVLKSSSVVYTESSTKILNYLGQITSYKTYEEGLSIIKPLIKELGDFEVIPGSNFDFWVVSGGIEGTNWHIDLEFDGSLGSTAIANAVYTGSTGATGLLLDGSWNYLGATSNTVQFLKDARIWWTEFANRVPTGDYPEKPIGAILDLKLNNFENRDLDWANIKFNDINTQIAWDYLPYINHTDIKWRVWKATEPIFEWTITGDVRTLKETFTILPYVGKYSVSCEIWDCDNSRLIRNDFDTIEVKLPNVTVSAWHSLLPTDLTFNRKESKPVSLIHNFPANNELNSINGTWNLPFSGGSQLDTLDIIFDDFNNVNYHQSSDDLERGPFPINRIDSIPVEKLNRVWWDYYGKNKSGWKIKLNETGNIESVFYYTLSLTSGDKKESIIGSFNVSNINYFNPFYSSAEYKTILKGIQNTIINHIKSKSGNTVFAKYYWFYDEYENGNDTNSPVINAIQIESGNSKSDILELKIENFFSEQTDWYEYNNLPCFVSPVLNNTSIDLGISLSQNGIWLGKYKYTKNIWNLCFKTFGSNSSLYTDLYVTITLKSENIEETLSINIYNIQEFSLGSIGHFQTNENILQEINNHILLNPNSLFYKYNWELKQFNSLNYDDLPNTIDIPYIECRLKYDNGDSDENNIYFEIQDNDPDNNISSMTINPIFTQYLDFLNNSNNIKTNPISFGLNGIGDIPPAFEIYGITAGATVYFTQYNDSGENSVNVNPTTNNLLDFYNLLKTNTEFSPNINWKLVRTNPTYGIGTPIKIIGTPVLWNENSELYVTGCYSNYYSYGEFTNTISESIHSIRETETIPLGTNVHFTPGNSTVFGQSEWEWTLTREGDNGFIKYKKGRLFSYLFDVVGSYNLELSVKDNKGNSGIYTKKQILKIE